MLNKNPRPAWRKFVKKTAAVVFIAEAISFAAFYGFWHRTNTNQEFRKYLNTEYPSVLEQYYNFGELLSSDNAKIRELDIKTWSEAAEK